MIFSKILLSAALSVASFMSTTVSFAAQPMDIQECDIPHIKVQMVYLRGDVGQATQKLPKTDNINGILDIVSNAMLSPTWISGSFKTYDFNHETYQLSIYDLEIRKSNEIIVSPNEMRSSSKYSKTRPVDMPMALPSMEPWTEATLETFLPCQKLNQVFGFDSNHIVTTLNSVFNDNKAIIEFNAIQRINNAQIANADPA